MFVIIFVKEHGMSMTEEQVKVICLLLLENLDRVGKERELKPLKNGLKHYKSLYFSGVWHM